MWYKLGVYSNDKYLIKFSINDFDNVCKKLANNIKIKKFCLFYPNYYKENNIIINQAQIVK